MNQKLLLGSALLVGMASTQQALARQKKAKEQTRPNVVFILADDLGYGDLSCYGQEKFETPNIDRLAQNGMRFTQCYSGTTVSAPSRSCLITGTHSVNGGLAISVPRGTLTNRESISFTDIIASCWHTAIIPIICGTTING